jgi:hypothetical protein
MDLYYSLDGCGITTHTYLGFVRNMDYTKRLMNGKVEKNRS